MELTDTHFILYPIAFECLLHFLFYSCVSSSFIVQDAFIIHDLCHVIVDCCFFFRWFHLSWLPVGKKQSTFI